MADPAPPFAALRVLEAACRLQSYSLTGEELGVTHSAVSQTVRRLERIYGQTLFRREGMHMAPSAAALALAQAYREAAGIVGRAGENLKVREGEGALVLSTAPSIAKLWLGPKLRRLSDALPDLNIEVRTGRELANLHSDGVDVALRIGRGHWPGLRSELLFEEYVFPVCSPEFLERHTADLCTDQCIADGPLIHEDINLWPAWFEAAGIRSAAAAARSDLRRLGADRGGRGRRAGRGAGAPAARPGGAGERAVGAPVGHAGERPLFLLPGLARRQPPHRRHPPLLRVGAIGVRPRRAAAGGLSLAGGGALGPEAGRDLGIERRDGRAPGPRGATHTADEAAMKSAPAATRGRQLAGMMPPMATQGINIASCHISRISGSAWVIASLVAVGKKAPNAT